MSNHGAQVQGPRRSAAGPLSRLFQGTKSDRCDLKSINRQIHAAGKGGCDINFIVPFGKMTDPINCYGGATIHYEEVAHKMDYKSLLRALRRGIFDHV